MSKKEAILARSTQIFLETGLSKMSMDELAKKIGISKKTIYNNFGSKDNLLKTIIESNIFELLSKVRESLSNDNISIVEKVETTFKLIFDFHNLFDNPINKHPDSAQFKNSIQLISMNEELNELAYEVAKDAKDKGFVREGVNVEMFPYIFTNIIISTANWVRPDNVTFSKLDLMRNTIQFVLDGIISPEKQNLFSKFK